MPKQKRSVNEVIADRLKDLQGVKWESQEALAAKAGVSQKTVSNCLNPKQRAASATGRVPSLTLAALELISAAVEAEVWELVAPFSEEEIAILRAYRNADDVGKAVVLRAAGMPTQSQAVDQAERALRENISESTSQRRKILKRG